jgi:hypothetical protein
MTHLARLGRLQVRVPEKVEQAHIVQLLRSIGAKVYVIGHPSPNDGRRHRGTGQTAGLPDLLVFLQSNALPGRWVVLFVECKALGGRIRPEQAVFQGFCANAAVEHIVGTFDAVIAWLVAHHYVKAEQFSQERPQKAMAQ